MPGKSIYGLGGGKKSLDSGGRLSRDWDSDSGKMKELDPDDLAASAVMKLFANDPSLHQDIIDYLASRPLSEKILTSKVDLVPAKQVQVIVIICLWMTSSGLGCLLWGISGAVLPHSAFTSRIQLHFLKDGSKGYVMPISWLTIWAIGVMLLVLNFVLINCVLWIPPLFYWVFREHEFRLRAKKND